jgi:hypothetical protein
MEEEEIKNLKEFKKDLREDMVKNITLYYNIHQNLDLFKNRIKNRIKHTLHCYEKEKQLSDIIQEEIDNLKELKCPYQKLDNKTFTYGEISIMEAQINLNNLKIKNKVYYDFEND